MSFPEKNVSLANQLVSFLISIDCKYVGISPGFRNSPFNLVANYAKAFQIFNHFDERCLAFYGLGIAKSKNAPVAISCTSGTALANFHPACLEAFYSRVPLIVLSADRPKKLVGTGSNQTMQQDNFFHNQVDRFIDIDAADTIEQNEEKLRKFSNQYCCAGPVHLNIRFEEPLLPTTYEAIPSVFWPASSAAQIELNNEFYRSLSKANNILVVLATEKLADNVEKALAEFLISQDIPLIVDATNQFSFRYKNKVKMIHFVQERQSNDFQPYSLLRIGAPPVHKKLLDWEKNAEQLFIIDHRGLRRSPTLKKAIYSEGIDVDAFEKLNNIKITSTALADSLLQKCIEFESRKNELIENDSSLTEWFVAKFVSEAIPSEATLVLGNSMPIRDFAHAARVSQKNIDILHFRGLSGIDGFTSAVSGISSQKTGPVIALCGDLTFLYDVNGLAFCKYGKKPLIFVVNDNDGGDIFRQVGTKNYSEELFVMPSNLNIREIAEGFSIHSKEIKTKNEFQIAFQQALNKQHTSVLICKINGEANQSIRRGI